MSYENSLGGYSPQPNLNQYGYQNYTAKNVNQPIGGSFIWVNSRKEAEEWPLGPNGALMMMNRNEKVFYLKSCDGFGMVQYFKEFPYYEKNNRHNIENTMADEKEKNVDYVNRKEFEALKAELEELKSLKNTRVIKEEKPDDEQRVIQTF